MKPITLKIPEELREELDDEADARGYSSRSEYLRDIIRRRHEVEDVRERYEERVEELKRELEAERGRSDELRRQLQERGRAEEKVDEIVEREKHGGEGGLLARVWRLIFGF
jgi:Arc/MetJ-type ribon-helix-helix transcriptional regulator